MESQLSTLKALVTLKTLLSVLIRHRRDCPLEWRSLGTSPTLLEPQPKAKNCGEAPASPLFKQDMLNLAPEQSTTSG